jgi:predicted dehydrogenase
VLTSGVIHSIDLMRYLCGEVTEVYAHVNNYFDRQNDSFVAMVRFAGGATALFHNHLLGEVRSEKLTIHGRRASAYLEGLAQRCIVQQDAFTHDLTAIEHVDPSAPQWADRPRQPYLNGWWDQDRYFLDCIHDRRPPASPASDLDDAVRTMELIDAIREQARGPLAASDTA